MSKEKFVVALELGSSHAKIGLAGFDPEAHDHQFNVYHIETLPTVDSIRYGRINNIREVTSVVETLIKALENKKLLENGSITGCFISIGGRSLKTQKVSSDTVLPERREITEDLIVRLETDALKSLSTNDELICVEPVRYAVDALTTARPLGTKGRRLHGEFSAVLCNATNKEDVTEVVANRLNKTIHGLSVRPIALAHMVLTQQEISAGCMLVDFGAETITVAIYKNYALQYLVTVPIGSRLITKDLSKVLAVTEEEAERIKITSGNAFPSKGAGDNPNQDTIDAVVTARLADIVANIIAQPGFARFSPADLPGGIVLTGGGARLRNFAHLLENESGMKVRVATITNGIVISDSEMSGADKLDIIALLCEGVEDMRIHKEVECVRFRRETAPRPERLKTDTEQSGSRRLAGNDFVIDRGASQNDDDNPYQGGTFGDGEPFVKPPKKRRGDEEAETPERKNRGTKPVIEVQEAPEEPEETEDASEQEGGQHGKRFDSIINKIFRLVRSDEDRSENM